MSQQRTILTTAGIMLGLFMASMEITVIATAMPTIVGELGGLSIYSWAFSIYMLASTTTVPIYGKLSDIYGRRPVFTAAMLLFLFGSVLCGFAQTMEQLIAFRAIQGLGAGGVMPLVFIIVGDIFSFEQRARMQGLFAGVWGVSSIAGPLLGGFLVDQLSWHWVFWVNVLPGIIAAITVWLAMQEPDLDHVNRPSVDYLGAVLLSVTVIALLLGLFIIDTLLGWSLLGVTLILLLMVLFWVERRAINPILPLSLFRERLFVTATGHGFLTGWAVFGSLSFVPLFVQAVIGTSATEAGSTLMPMLLGWVFASIIGSRALLYINYRIVIMVGVSLLTIGSFFMAYSTGEMSRTQAMISLGLMGVGMGFSVSPFLIAIQNAVPKRELGTATSTLQFCRNIGGTLGVSVMGVVLTQRLSSGLIAAGLEPDSISLDSLVDPVAGSSAAVALDGALRTILGSAIQGVFVVAFVAAALSWLVSALAPGGRLSSVKPADNAAVSKTAPALASSPGHD
ncbi:MAG: MDR family MFS transporter [Chloroflexota bacterium]